MNNINKYYKLIAIIVAVITISACVMQTSSQTIKVTKNDYVSAKCYNLYVKQMGGVCRYINVKAQPYDKTINRTFDIYYSIVPATSKSKHKKEPIVFLVGGPGQSATSLIDYVLKYHTPYQKLLKHHDFIFVDYRGTGFSLPYPACDSFDADNYVGSINTCVKHLPTNVKLSDITTSLIAYDINQILKKEKIKKAILFGGSYGTRVASTIAREYPKRVSKMVLDGFFPIEVNGISQAKESLLSKLSIIRAKYNKKYKKDNFETRLIKYLENIKPKERLNRIIKISLMAYDSDVDSKLHKEFNKPNNKLWQKSKDNNINFTPMVDKKYASRTGDSQLMLFAIILREEYAFIKTQKTKTFKFSNKLIAMMDGFNGGSPISIDKLQKIKIKLSRADIKDTKPLKSKIPTLILSGGLDLFTPAYWAKNAQKYLPNSKHFLFVDKNHVLSTSSNKAVDIIDAFINTNNENTLDKYSSKNIKIIK